MSWTECAQQTIKTKILVIRVNNISNSPSRMLLQQDYFYPGMPHNLLEDHRATEEGSQEIWLPYITLLKDSVICQNSMTYLPPNLHLHQPGMSLKFFTLFVKEV